MPRRAFTLIELLVVMAIIAVLAAIIFPVFATYCGKARQTSCGSNERQIGTAILMYAQDHDERLFFYGTTRTPSQSRSGAVLPNAESANPVRWWNALMPYLKSPQILVCPDDEAPTLSNDAAGQATIRRSYIACRFAEALALAQVELPTETMVVTEKWGRAPDGSPVTDSWIEPFNGDFNYDPVRDRMALAANRHTGGINSTFLDGHSRWMKPQAIVASRTLSGCELVHAYPLLPSMCDKSVPGCTNTGAKNLCNAFTYP